MEAWCDGADVRSLETEGVFRIESKVKDGVVTGGCERNDGVVEIVDRDVTMLDVRSARVGVDVRILKS